MITIIGRRLIIPDCDRVLGVVGDKNTPVKIKLSENTLESYLPGANGFGDVAIILKLKHETATVTVPPILCGHDKDGVYVGDLSILSSVKSGLVTAQAMIVLPGSATDDNALNDAQSIWQSDEDYFYIADDIELKSFSSGSDTYTAFQNLLGAVTDKVVAAETAKEVVTKSVESFNKSFGEFETLAGSAFELQDFGWTKFEYTLPEAPDAFCSVADDRINIGGTGQPIIIHCSGETLGFTFSISGYGDAKIKINGETTVFTDSYNDGREFVSDVVIPLTYMKSDIEFSGGMKTWTFKDMKTSAVKGLSELDANIKNTDQSLQAHIENRDNPHDVTAEQVGAYTKEEVDKKLENIDVSIDIDKELNSSSDNAIANSAVTKALGDIDTALDKIIAIQNELKGGDEPTIPENILLSADGLMLTDIDGIYLMPAISA